MSRVLLWSRSHRKSGRHRELRASPCLRSFGTEKLRCENTESFGRTRGTRSRAVTTQPAHKPWQDPALAVAARVDALLAELTLEEKIGQLGSRWVGNDMQDEQQIDNEETLNVAPMADVFAKSGTISLE